MTRRHLMAGLAALALAVPALAEGGQKPPAPPPPPAEKVLSGDAPPPPPPAPTPTGRARKVGPNVRVEVTLTEQRPDVSIQPKTVTVTTTDGYWGRVRSQVTTARMGGAPLNVDARPELQSDGRILLSLNIEFGEKPEPEPGKGQADPPAQDARARMRIVESTLNESVTVALDSGKPLTITQSADPMRDRKVTVEVKATVLKN